MLMHCLSRWHRLDFYRLRASQQNPSKHRHHFELTIVTLLSLSCRGGPFLQWKVQPPELAERLKRYKLLLPESLLERGLSNLGDLKRLETAFQKLVKGTVQASHALSLQF